MLTSGLFGIWRGHRKVMDSYLGSDGQKGSDGQIFYKMANLDDRIKK
jgi:hypothetical protein